MAREIAKAYEPQQIEPRWAEFWVSEKLFRADANAPGPVFSIVIPPPNVTGSLHIGHMLNHTEIDILTRWHRMRGYNTLFLPGMDHAGISTQRVVVRQLAEQGIDYRELGREEFERRVWRWKEESGGTILLQMRQIGDSCDWSREKFTLSPELSRVVREAFVRLYEEGLIYRDKRMTNWCPVCLTVLSDLEVLHAEKQGHLWHISYPVVGSKDAVVVATTRPETMLGDTAVAVHPEDGRYKQLIGETVLLPLANREIPIIADEIVDREFGTGAVKITPAHDPNDFEVGRRHDLPEIEVMTDDGRMSAAAGKYAGMDRFDARKKIVEDLKSQGLLRKVSEHMHSIALCERSKTIVEPRVSTQWFCRMKPLAQPAIAAVERGDIRMVPENRREEYFNWMRNIRDWTLSRQLWWGHRIPAWYCAEHNHVTVAREAPSRCSTCGSQNLTQDPDVLDTWFSSGLWPFSTLGWPAETQDFKTYYPTTLLITAYDILFFWVARMIMLGIHFTGRVPFHAVYLHTLVRTSSGEKMSKSKGTGLDPVVLNQKYGTDAMRFCLASMAAPGTDIVLSDDRLTSARNFANKIWNAARLLFLRLDKFEASGASLEELAGPEVRSKAPYAIGAEASLVDRWLFARLAETISRLNAALEDYRFHEAAQGVYQFFWGDFCDWYIEWVKPELASPNQEPARVAWKNIFAAFDAALRLLHPFMPFLTEELWHQLPQAAGARSISLDEFPASRSEWRDPDAVTDFALIQDVVTKIRDIRAEAKFEPRRKLRADVSCIAGNDKLVLENNKLQIERAGALSELKIRQGTLGSTVGHMRATARFDVLVAWDDDVDSRAELPRLRKELDKLARDIESKKNQLADQEFLSKAPVGVVNKIKATLSERQLEHFKLAARLDVLTGQGEATR